MQDDNEIFESLLIGGVIGAALGALITNNKSGSSLGAIAGAAILASYAANEKARKTNIPLLIKENNTLYEIKSDGSKRFIKSIPQNKKHLPKKFTLK